MSSRELNRVELMGGVGSGELKLREAAVILELSYRQTKRLWRRYRQVGSKGLKHGNAGRASNRSKPQKLRRRVLNLIREKYSGFEGWAMGRLCELSLRRFVAQQGGRNGAPAAQFSLDGSASAPMGARRKADCFRCH